jgi:hypothetical protein
MRQWQKRVCCNPAHNEVFVDVVGITLELLEIERRVIVKPLPGGLVKKLVGDLPDEIGVVVVGGHGSQCIDFAATLCSASRCKELPLPGGM